MVVFSIPRERKRGLINRDIGNNQNPPAKSYLLKWQLNTECCKTTVKALEW